VVACNNKILYFSSSSVYFSVLKPSNVASSLAGRALRKRGKKVLSSPLS